MINKRVYWVVTDDKIIPIIRESKITKQDILDELIYKYNNFVTVENSYHNALCEFYKNRYLFIDGSLPISKREEEELKKHINTVSYLEACYYAI